MLNSFPQKSNSRLIAFVIPSVMILGLTLSGCASHSSETSTTQLTESTASVAQAQIIESPKEKKERELNDEKLRQEFKVQWEKEQKKEEEKQEAKLKAEKVAQEKNNEADAKVDKLIELGVVTKMDCEFNEVFINPDEWAGADVYTKENFARSLMDYCYRHGGSDSIVNIKSDMDGKELGSIGLFGFKVK